MFESGRELAVGDIVIPSATLPNNANGQRMWTVVEASGPTGEEPEWPQVTSIPSDAVRSGGVTFVCNHDNGIAGIWEPYNGAMMFPPTGFMAEIRNALYISEGGNYSGFLNGEEMTKQTAPIPVNPTLGTAMRYPIRTLYLGQLGINTAIDLGTITPYVGQTAEGMMPRSTAFHKHLLVWGVPLAPEALLDLTGQGL